MDQNGEITPKRAKLLIKILQVVIGLAFLVLAAKLVMSGWAQYHTDGVDPEAGLTMVISILGLFFGGKLSDFFVDPIEWIKENAEVSKLRKRWFLLTIALNYFVGAFALYMFLPLAEEINSYTVFYIALAAVPIAQLVVGGFASMILFGVVGAYFLIYINWPIKILQKITEFDKTITMYNAAQVALPSYMMRFSYWLEGKEMPAPPPDDESGARFATYDEIGQLIIDSSEAKHGTVFGHVAGVPLLIHTEKHVLIMASTRSGKGVSLIIPHLLRYKGSAFVLDPKGENARATGRQREALNGKVHYLDPFGISGKPQARFNPLSRFTLDNMEAESKALASALVLGQQTGASVRDHWSASAQQLIAALIMHIFTSDTIPPEEKDLPTVRRLLLKDLNKMLKEMLESTAADGLISALAASFLTTPENEFGSIVSTAQRETEILDNPYIAACLSASGNGQEVNFADWKNNTMSVYLCLSAPKFPVFNRWLRLVLTAALDEMTDTLNPPPIPVCFMLDELATLGHLSVVENAIGLSAGYGVQLFTVFQDTAQMKDLYRGRWASFVANAGVRTLFNLDDYETAKYWSDTLGSHLVKTESSQQDIYGFTHGQNVGQTMRPLISTDDMMLYFAQGKMLVIPQGSRPIVSDRAPYFKDDKLTGLWDDPRAEGAKP